MNNNKAIKVGKIIDKLIEQYPFLNVDKVRPFYREDQFVNPYGSEYMIEDCITFPNLLDDNDVCLNISLDGPDEIVIQDIKENLFVYFNEAIEYDKQCISDRLQFLVENEINELDDLIIKIAFPLFYVFINKGGGSLDPLTSNIHVNYALASSFEIRYTEVYSDMIWNEMKSVRDHKFYQFLIDKYEEILDSVLGEFKNMLDIND